MTQRIAGKESGADWLERHLSSKKATAILSPFARTVADIVGQVWRGIYHMDTSQPWLWKERQVHLYFDNWLATYDWDHLTQLVLLCHEHCIRLAIKPCMVWEHSSDAKTVVREWDGTGFQQIGKNPDHFKVAMPYLHLIFSPRKRVDDVTEGHPTIEEAVANARALGAPIAKAPVPVVAPEPVCSTCNDSHTMVHSEDGHEDKYWMCTRCPTPCRECRGGGSAYCSKTPCTCECHRKGNA